MKIKLLKILPLFMLLWVVQPACAADASGGAASGSADKTATAKDKPSNAREKGAAKDEGKLKTKSDSAKDKTEASGPEERESRPGEYSCRYYTVNLPEGWQPVIAPTEQHGLVNALFAAKDRNPSITILVGQNGGADAKTIAGMFAEQFKAPKQPIAQNGQYSFQFPQHDGLTARAIVTCADKEFMVVTITGSMREGQRFLRDNIKSEDYKDLLPKF